MEELTDRDVRLEGYAREVHLAETFLAAGNILCHVLSRIRWLTTWVLDGLYNVAAEGHAILVAIH